MKLLRQTTATQVGMYHKPGELAEVTIQGSLQPVGQVMRQTYPEGTFNADDAVLFVFGSVAIEIGDFVVMDDNSKYKITRLAADWRDQGNYAKYVAEKVKA